MGFARNRRRPPVQVGGGQKVKKVCVKKVVLDIELENDGD